MPLNNEGKTAVDKVSQSHSVGHHTDCVTGWGWLSKFSFGGLLSNRVQPRLPWSMPHRAKPLGRSNTGQSPEWEGSGSTKWCYKKQPKIMKFNSQCLVRKVLVLVYETWMTEDEKCLQPPNKKLAFPNSPPYPHLTLSPRRTSTHGTEAHTPGVSRRKELGSKGAALSLLGQNKGGHLTNGNQLFPNTNEEQSKRNLQRQFHLQ